MTTKRYTTAKRPRTGDSSAITTEEIYFSDKAVFKDDLVIFIRSLASLL